MSSKWASSNLSEESSAGESDNGQPKSKKSKQVELSGHSSAVSGDEQQGRKSRSRSKSGSGSDSGTARSGSSGSRTSKKSRSGSDRSASRTAKGNLSDSGTGGSGHSSQERHNKGNRERSNSSGSAKSGASPAPKRRRSQSPSSGGSSSGSASPQPGRSSPRKSPRGGEREKVYSSSNASSQQQKSDSSSSSTKEKKLKKSKEHKASSKLEKQFTNQDSDDEGHSSDRRKSPKKRIPKKSKNASSSEGELPGDWRDECDDGLDDEYIGNDEDRRMLESLTEREREEEFYRRAEKREELKKRFEISQKLKKQHKQREEGFNSSDQDRDGSPRMGDQERGSSETRSENYSHDPMSRKKGYEEKYGSKFSALSELKAKREEKERKEKIREAKLKKHKRRGKNNVSDSASGSDYEKLGRKKKGKDVLKARDIYSSSSSDASGGDVRRKTSSSSSSSSSSQSDGESDTERQSSKKIVKKAMNIETMGDLEKIRLSRFKLDKFVHLPCFKRTVVGCYVRIGIGKSPDGRDVYRCCEIVDTCETGKIYNVMKTKTNVGLKLRHGKDTRIFRLQFVSNSPLSETEFEKYKKACVEGNTSLPTYAHLEQKEKDIKYALEYRFSTADVEKILASKKKFDTRPKNFAMFKAELQKKRDTAQHTGDMDKVGEYDTQLLEIEKRAEELDAKRTSTISTIALVNDRNRKDNVARAYRGIKQEERRRLIEGDIDDPFTRRKTKPKLGNTKQKGQISGGEMTSELLLKLETEKKAAEAAKKIAEIKPLIPATTVDFSKKGGKMLGNNQQVDIFDAHDFELDINVDDMQKSALTPTISLKPVTASSTPSGPHKRSIKLDEWKKKRGII